MKNRKEKSTLRKRLSALLLCAAMMVGLLTVGASAAQEITDITAQLCPNFNIVVNGTAQTFYDSLGQEAHPIVYNGTTYLPLRAIGELMDRNVNWDQSTLTVTLSGTRTTPKIVGTPDENAKQKEISAQIRRDFTIVVDGVKRSFTDSTGAAAYPLLYNGTTYLPLKSIGELMGSAVGWDADTRTVSLTFNPDSLVTDADSFYQNSAGAEKPVQTAQPSANGTIISVETARAKALSHAGLTAGQVTFVSQKLKWDDGRRVYDLEFYTEGGKKEYDYKIDASTGAVISFDYDAEQNDRGASKDKSANSGSYIGEEKARSIALSKVPGASAGNVTKLKLDYDDGRYEYEVEIVYNSMEYDFEIDAISGEILSQEAEPVHK